MSLTPLLILSHGHGLGRARIWDLIQRFGSAEEVCRIGWDPQRRLLFEKWSVAEWERDLEEAQSAKVDVIPYDHSLYPQALLQLNDFPLLLYVKGTLHRDDQKGIALVGTRTASLYGKEQAERIAQELSFAGICVISGLARGIDGSAHRGALKAKGRTIAVMGAGLNHVYPNEHRDLAETIAHSGALISEFPMQSPPFKGNFPRRNRIVSAYAQGVCLIESPREGGGMLTMQLAQAQNKPLFALPGRVDLPTFSGNHLLIKQKIAHLIESGEDILKYFNINTETRHKASNLPLLSSEEIAFLASLPPEEKSIEELVLLTQLPIIQLNVFLTRLVLKKVIKEFPGKVYKKI